MKNQEKIDLCRLHAQEYAAPKKPILIDVKQGIYLAISGQGAPGEAVFTDKIGALYGVAFTVKMTRKFAGQQDYVISKLECQWWCEETGQGFGTVAPDLWCWKLLIRTPEFVSQDELDRAISVLLEKGKSSSTKEMSLEALTEGLCVQMLHVGPYEREPETIAIMRDFAEKAGAQLHGRHHEIYLSDPRRVPSERLKTILRCPLIKV